MSFPEDIIFPTPHPHLTHPFQSIQILEMLLFFIPMKKISQLQSGNLKLEKAWERVRYLDTILDNDSCKRFKLGDHVFDVAYTTIIT
jgi:hypothetical protein